MREKGSKLIGLIFHYFPPLKKLSKKTRKLFEKHGFFPWFTKGFELVLELLLHITNLKLLQNLDLVEVPILYLIFQVQKKRILFLLSKITLSI